MNHRLAQLRSPVALLTGIALLCAALAGVLAFSGRAHAATQLGKFTLTPTTGSISTYPMVTSVTTTAGCPDDTVGKAAILKVFNPTSDTTQATLGQGATKIVAGTAPFTMNVTTLAAAKSLEARLRTWIPDGSLDGTYTLGLGCGGGTDVPVFLAKVRVTGDTWSLLEQQATTLAVGAASGVAVGGDLKLTATVSPSTAAGSVEFKNGDTSLGTAQVTNGTAELTVKAPAIGGPLPFSAVFTPTDADSYSSAEASGTANIDYVVSAKDADGTALGDKPTLSVGQKVKVTVKGFTPAAAAHVTLTNSTATFADVTANADGAVADYAFTVPNALTNGDHTLNFSEKSGIYAAFDFVSTDEVSASPSPSDNPDLTVTDEDGNTLGADPNLEAGQKVKITARGYTASAAVKVTLVDSESTFDDAKANADGTVENYAFTVPKDIADGDHTLTLAEDKTDGHSVDFAFTTGSGDSSESPEPSASASDSSGTDTGGTGSGGSDTGGSTGGDSGGSGSGGGSMASTGAQVGAIGLASLAFLAAGGALVLHMRRKGLLTFGGDTPQHH
ncbi:Ig-like domain repeat protein [Streptomyces hyaluromycini]|uniref:Ig-like domain repeat protein n=1 Tax=Streptomyces hyaluromycini TaxID=1377993 RepID=UPI000B5C4A4D|nr:Ig-like domain repeat protein [Streptomyces hyaluromycini]